MQDQQIKNPTLHNVAGRVTPLAKIFCQDNKMACQGNTTRCGAFLPTLEEQQPRSDVKRNWLLSASWVQLRTLLKPPVYHITIVFRCLMGTFNWAPIMQRDASLSEDLRETGKIIFPAWISFREFVFQYSQVSQWSTGRLVFLLGWKSS